MSVNFWMSFMRVMGRIGIWKPYLTFIERILNYLDRAVEKESEGKTPFCPECAETLGSDAGTQREIILYYLLEKKTDIHRCPRCKKKTRLVWMNIEEAKK